MRYKIWRTNHLNDVKFWACFAAPRFPYSPPPPPFPGANRPEMSESLVDKVNLFLIGSPVCLFLAHMEIVLTERWSHFSGCGCVRNVKNSCSQVFICPLLLLASFRKEKNNDREWNSIGHENLLPHCFFLPQDHTM